MQYHSNPSLWIASTSNTEEAEFEWFIDFPGGSNGKASAYNVGNLVQSLGREDLLEKEMASHSRILAWEIPSREEPGGLQSMGLAKNGTGLND